jgi:hypothetical protein
MSRADPFYSFLKNHTKFLLSHPLQVLGTLLGLAGLSELQLARRRWVEDAVRQNIWSGILAGRRAWPLAMKRSSMK